MNGNLDDDYNHALKQRHRPTVQEAGLDEETFAEARAATAAMREVDDEITARLRGEAPCS